MVRFLHNVTGDTGLVKLLKDPDYQDMRGPLMSAIRADCQAFAKYCGRDRSAATPVPVAMSIMYGLCDHACPPNFFHLWKFQTALTSDFIIVDQATSFCR